MSSSDATIPTRRFRLTPLGSYGLAALAIAGSVHFATYLGHPLSPDHPLFWGLHVGIFPLFFAFINRLRRWQMRTTGMFGFSKTALRWGDLIGWFPSWVPVVAVALMAYAMLNFLFSTSHLPARGSVTSTPDVALYTTRAFSGHWLIFYAIPTLFFSYVPADARPAEVSNDVVT